MVQPLQRPRDIELPSDVMSASSLSVFKNIVRIEKDDTQTGYMYMRLLYDVYICVCTYMYYCTSFIIIIIIIFADTL